MMKPLSQYRRNTIRQINQTDHNVDRIKRHIKPHTSPHPLAEEARRQRHRTTLMTYVRTWTIKLARPDRSTDLEDVLRHEMMATKPGTMNTIKFALSTVHRCHLNSVVM